MNRGASKSMTLPPLYPITPGGLDKGALLAWVDALLEEGCTLLQYRRKALSDREQLLELERILGMTARYGAYLIVDDRCDLCKMSGAQGVHLGQTDLPPEQARAFLGPEALIGFSAHNLKQVESALREPVDYLALGPVFPTRTKKDPDPVVQAESQIKILAKTSLPMVAIGGITADGAVELWRRGFNSVAVISALEENTRAVWGKFMRLHGEQAVIRSSHGS